MAGSARLLRWYDRHRRDLPWRHTRDPWAILVSEVMLQQTTVAAVVPYYERFLARWPEPAALARAPEDELLAAWAGLGYYRRARNLQATASAVAEGWPTTAEGLLSLPGIGPYTSAAVASIAFGEPVAVVDGNVERVLARVLALPGDVKRAPAAARLRAAAQALVDPARPGDSNQALMELGATVCRPKQPACPRCPLRDGCRAREQGEPERYPARAARAPAVAVIRLAAVVRRADGAILLRRRTEPPNAGFCELPALDAPRASGPALVRHLRDEHGLSVSLQGALPVHRHTITRYKIAVHPFTARLVAGRVRPPLVWGQPGHALPLTTATHRVLAP